MPSAQKTTPQAAVKPATTKEKVPTTTAAKAKMGRPHITYAEHRAMLLEHLPMAIKKVKELAEAGSETMLKLIVERGVAAVKPMELPQAIALPRDASAQAQAVVAAIGKGELPIEAGAKLLGAMAAAQQVTIQAELQQRLASMEARLQELKNAKGR